MRISGIDHLRGFFISLAIIFSLWQSMYSKPDSFSMLKHVVVGHFYPGDLIFPFFLFCSGASLWLLLYKIKMKRLGIHEAEKKYLNLLLLGSFLCGTRLFSTFPDEVVLIAISALVSINIFWLFGLTGIYLAFGLLVFSFLFLWTFFPWVFGLFYFKYLNGEIGIPYFLAIYLSGFIVSSAAFPRAQASFESIRRAAKLLLLFSVATFLSLLIWPPYRANLSISFLMLSIALSIFALIFSVFLFDFGKKKIHLFLVLGQNSIWGWVLISLFFSLSLVFDFINAVPEIFYLPFCVSLIFLLYAALVKLKMEKS
ncbi:MAG: hypothetical protein N3G80_02165 [Candidatus Micrarchaeota archaeon]|nr:hypothetical protein [Candidatus Micrarchaeota archaeon]